MANPTVQRMADSAVGKIALYIVTAMAVPAAFAAWQDIKGDLKEIKVEQVKSQVDAREIEIRLKRIEVSTLDLEIKVRKLSDDVLRLQVADEQRRAR